MNYPVVTLDDYLTKHDGKASLVMVTDDAMVKAGLVKGDLIAIEQREVSPYGSIVAAVQAGKPVVRYLECRALVGADGSRIEGKPELLGVMVALIRRTRPASKLTLTK